MTKRFYLVTFDLIGSRGRENEYKRAEDALTFRFGKDNYWKLVKQCAVVRTNQDARAIRDVLQQRLGRNCNILVMRLRRGYAFSIRDPLKRQAAKDCLQQIPSLP
jgi:hypothetical protein